jgi:hypothetical protein
MDIFLNINQLPDALKDELIRRLLSSDTFEDTTDWLHGEFYRAIFAPSYQALINWRGVENSTLGAYCFGLELGVKFSEIITLRRQIEALGIESVRQKLLAKLTEKKCHLFALLGDREGKQ